MRGQGSAMMTPEAVIAALGLHRGTCGYMNVNYRSPLGIAPDGAAERTIGQSLFFLVTPEAPVSLHRIQSDQVYHYYAGAPLEVLLLPEQGEASMTVVGTDLAAGMCPQVLIPAGTFHAARLLGGGEWALLGSTSWPGVADGEFEWGEPAALGDRHPAWAEQLATFSAGPSGRPRR